MNDRFEELVIDVRASTAGFVADVETMRRSVDGSLLDGFGRAGNVLENGLLGALRRGSLGFDDLKRVAFRALDEIAAHALQSGFASLFGSAGRRRRIGGIARPDVRRAVRFARTRHRWPGCAGTCLSGGGARAGSFHANGFGQD
jgi:hypothetical protein